MVHKAKHVYGGLDPGEVVLVASEDKRFNRILGIVQVTIIGRDGTPRTVKVRTANDVLVRPYQRLYRLEVSDAVNKKNYSEVCFELSV